MNHISYPCYPLNRANGISEIEGKAARVAASERGTSEFQSVVEQNTPDISGWESVAFFAPIRCLPAVVYEGWVFPGQSLFLEPNSQKATPKAFASGRRKPRFLGSV